MDETPEWCCVCHQGRDVTRVSYSYQRDDTGGKTLSCRVRIWWILGEVMNNEIQYNTSEG